MFIVTAPLLPLCLVIQETLAIVLQITTLLWSELHWLEVPESVTYRCLHGQTPQYLSDHTTPALELALHFANWRQLFVPHCRLSTSTAIGLFTSAKEVMFLPDFVCLSVCMCVQDNSKSYGRIFLKFWGYVGHGISYKWLNFGCDPAGILDSGSLWNFCYHCVKVGIREPLAKRQCIQSRFLGHVELGHCGKCNYSWKHVGEIYVTIWQALGGGVRATTVFLVDYRIHLLASSRIWWGAWTLEISERSSAQCVQCISDFIKLECTK